LLAKGADINATTNIFSFDTPLHAAAAHAIKRVELLLANKRY